MRILGLDVGTVRTGVALSDEMGWTAQPLEVMKRLKGEADFARLGEIIAEFGVTEIVVGLPRNMNGSIGPMAQSVQAYAKELIDRFGLPVHEWDERLTTVTAERALIEGNVRRAKRKELVDKVSAAVILQGYLDFRGR